MKATTSISDQQKSRCHDVCHILNRQTRCETGNALQLLNSGEEYVPAMLAAIANARAFVDIELYRVDPGHLLDRFMTVFAIAAERKVRVRLLADSFGSRRMGDSEWGAFSRLGVHVSQTPRLWTSIVFNRSTRRDHRKLLVVDRENAFTGGMSIDDTFFRPHGEPTWRESMVNVRGPLVGTMQRAFDEAWDELRDVSPAGGSSRTFTDAHGCVNASLILSTPRQARGESLFTSAILGARTAVSITNAFVVPSDSISTALIKAARRGVDVRLLVPGRYHRFEMVREAMRGFYDGYLRPGIRIFEYEAAMLHAKTMVVDEQWACVGSFNLDSRSFVYNDEIAIAACDSGFACAVASAFTADCGYAREITLKSWRERSVVSRSRQAGLRLLRRYL